MRVMPFARHLVDEGPETPARNGIDAARGFIEEDHARSVEDRAGESQPLFPAPGQRLGDEIFLALQARGLNRPRLALAHRRAGEAVDPAEETQILNDGQIVIETEALGHVADPVLQGLGVLRDVDAEDARASGGGSEETAQHADGRGLARAVRAEKAEHLALPHGERQVVHGRERAEPLDQMIDLDHRGTARRTAVVPGGHHLSGPPPG